MRRRRSWMGACGAVAFSVACSGGGDAAPASLQSIVRDSAGVVIVENERPADESRVGWRVGPEPTLSIGTLEGAEAYQLFRVVDAPRLPDGRIVVANRGSNELRVFDGSGAYQATWGREGEGPGEFTGLNSIEAWPGDSLLAYDFNQRRLTVFDTNGELGRTVLMQDNEEIGYPTFRHVMPDGQLMVRGANTFTAGEIGTGMTRPDAPFGVMSSEGDVTAVLGSFPSQEAYVAAGEGFMSVFQHPFGRGTLTEAWGSRLLVSQNDTYELRAFSATGNLELVLRRDHTPASPTEGDLAAHWDELYGDEDPEQRERMMDMVSGIPLVGPFPAFRRLEVDALGYLWVQDYDKPGDEQTLWTVFDQEGRVLGFVETPHGLRVREIGEEYILGQTTDDFEVEYVQLWPLRRET